MSVLNRLRPLLTHVILLAVAFFYLFPFAWMLGSSLKTPGEFFTAGLQVFPAEAQWHNYVDAWSKARFGTYFLNTFLVAAGSTLMLVLITSAAGYTLARTTFPGRAAVVAVMVLLFFLPGGYTVIPLYDLVTRLGLLSTLWAVILVITAGSIIYNTILFSGYFTTLSRDVEESALVDGASTPVIFWRIALPQATPMIATVGLFHFMYSWNSFFIPLIFTLGNPKLRTLAVGMQAFVGENQTQWTWICAGAAMTIVPIMLLFFFMQRYFVDAIAGAVKG
ncbi:carbohydrate ABC transporter permease [Deinococcus pimensis]|uniref:carbohydrate ABC transporter permease n=1 Tax=Deinococcus pimensis TaxID=309888 RepID=UPI0004818F98|nr:carbohydrate ABC transporter permease [Deinococcus pimensis]